MGCNCGWMTVDHEVVRGKQIIGNYARCSNCGRVEWLWKADDYDLKMNLPRVYRRTKK